MVKKVKMFKLYELIFAPVGLVRQLSMQMGGGDLLGT